MSTIPNKSDTGVKAVVEAVEKVLELKGDQVTDQQRAAVCGLRAIYSGRIIEDIKSDLASGNVTMEKRVQLDVETGKVVFEWLKTSPMGKMILELVEAEQVNALRMNLKNQILLGRE